MSKHRNKRWSKKRYWLLATVTLFVSLAVALTLAELALRWQRSHIEASDRLDSGMILFDQRLGWRLAPGWAGRHEHYDFGVTYSINRYGYRGLFSVRNAKNDVLRRVAVVGDSFTFGMGVDDDDTFVALLQRQAGSEVEYLNLGVPGFSTDQEALLIQERVFAFEPDLVLLVVYLANDLIDNELAFPLQADNAKPYFELSAGELILRNSPVPLARKPVDQRARTLASEVWGKEGPAQVRGLDQLLTRLELARRLGFAGPRASNESGQFEERFHYPLDLFSALIRRIKKTCESRGIPLTLALLPGRSFVEQPTSASAAFQDYLRDRVVERMREMGVRVIDLAAALRASRPESPRHWYYPHDGHLTPEGHQMVAAILRRADFGQP